MSAADDASTAFCKTCRKAHPITDFPLKKRNNPDGKQRTAKCCRCLPARADEKENIAPGDPDVVTSKQRARAEEPLPPSELNDFVALLSQQAEIIKIEACIKTDGIVSRVGTDHRAIADELAKIIWEKTQFRFRYHSKDVLKSATTPTTRFSYTCAQNAERKHKSEKTAVPDKQRDKISLVTFDCRGWLHISVADGASAALVKLEHHEDHVHYQSVTLPPDVVEIINNNPGLTIWQMVQKKHPTPSFSRKAVYNLWAQRDSAKWKLDQDELKSAEILLERGKKAGGLGMYEICPINIKLEQGFEALAWSLPTVLNKWGGRIREVALDSAWETNGRRFELYALLGEAYGSGLPLGFLLLHSKGGAPGGTQRILEQFIGHFVERLEHILVTHTDKNLPEINAFRAKVAAAKHQLCFWHSLRAVKVRLSILRRQPAHYDATGAHAAFNFISPTFLPVAQRAADSAPVQTAAKTLPTITVRLNGEVVARPVPSFRIRLPPRMESEDAVREDADAGTRDASVPASAASVNPQAIPDAAPGLSFTRATTTPESEDSDEELDDEFADLLEKALDGVEDDETDEEDGPDWLFEDGEQRSTNPSYVFCPAEHRKQLLRLFTRHFVQHPLLLDPDQNGRPRSADEIRYRAVESMYSFCYTRGLTEVWAYMWTSWYSPKMWKLWALSASTRIPRLRTTMIVENFWKQVKHDWLHHLTRPRLDQLVYILCTELVPVYIQRAEKLENAYHYGRSREQTSSQVRMKREWKRLARLPIHKSYRTSVANWLCDCGAQKYSAHLLCKHLVQAVPKPSPEFWIFIHRHRTVPFYQHPELHTIGEPEGDYIDADEGCITDGDDQVWNGDPRKLKGGGGWRDMMEGRAAEELHLKRKRSDTPASAWDESSSVCDDAASQHTYDASEIDGADADETAEQEQQVRERMRKRAKTLRFLADAIDAQLDKAAPNDVKLWLRTTNKMPALDALEDFAADIRLKEHGRVRRGTWGSNKRGRKFSRSTMGYQTGLLTEDNE